MVQLFLLLYSEGTSSAYVYICVCMIANSTSNKCWKYYKVLDYFSLKFFFSAHTNVRIAAKVLRVRMAFRDNIQCCSNVYYILRSALWWVSNLFLMFSGMMGIDRMLYRTYTPKYSRLFDIAVQYS